MIRPVCSLFFCVLLAGCLGAVPFAGQGADVLAPSGGAYTLKLPEGWAVSGRSQQEGARVSVAAHRDAAATGKGYPTLVVKEVHEPTAQGVLDLMARDRNLEYSGLWGVSAQRYQLRQALLDDKSRVLTYWLAPRDGQGLEYYACVHLARFGDGFGRIEMVGVAQAGTMQKYIKDFNAMFAALDISEAARFTPAGAPDTAAGLRAAYSGAVEAELEGLRRQAAETASWAAGGGLTAQEKGFLSGAYARAAASADEAGGRLLEIVRAARGDSARADASGLSERLEASATALETIQLNLAEQSAKASVEKTAQRVRRLAQLGREFAKLPF